MDLQCPAMILCLTPNDELPEDLAGHRVVAGYLFHLAEDDVHAPLPLHTAPEGKFWPVMEEIADAHRGEGVAIFAPAQDLESRGVRMAAFSVDSQGPLRIDPSRPVDNPYRTAD